MQTTLFTTLLLSLTFTSLCFADWEIPNTPLASIGDPGNLYLNTTGLTYHFNNNDFAGQTDKLMSGSMGIYFYYLPKEKNTAEGYELSVNARLLIPVVATRFDQQNLPTPKGTYGDSIELRAGYSRIIEGFKLEASASADLYGHYNGDEIQKRIHRVIGSDNHQDKYGSKFEGSFLTGSLGFGKLLGPDLLAMIYYRNAAVIKDFIFRLNYKHQWGDWQFGAQYLIAKQDSSNLYETSDLEEHRTEWAVGMKYKWYQNSISYVSRYLSYDQFGQYYIDPLIISYEF